MRGVAGKKKTDRKEETQGKAERRDLGRRAWRNVGKTEAREAARKAEGAREEEEA